MSRKYFKPFSTSDILSTLALNRRLAQLDNVLIGLSQAGFEFSDHTTAPVAPVSGYGLYIKNGQLYQQDSAGVETLLQSVVPSYARLENQQPQNTADSNAVVNVWTARVINTIVSDDDSIVSDLSSNQFTLVAGTYILNAWIPFGNVSVVGCRFYDVTNAVLVTYGLSTFGSASNHFGTIAYQWTIAAPAQYQIEAYAAAAQPLAVAANFDTEQYTCVELWKIA